jgi:multidrug efflux pump subunit AcrA (membrane-fusion protein)
MSRDSQYEGQAAAIRDEVRRTVQQLSQLAQSERNFDQFCNEALARLVQITGAYGALLWQANGASAPRLTHQSGSPPNEAARAITAGDNPQHNTVLMEVLTQQQPVGLAAEAFQGGQAPANVESPASDVVLLFSPVFNRSSQCWGTLELVQRGDITTQAQEGYLRFLTQIAQLFQRWHEHQDLARLTANQDQWKGKLEYVTEVHRHLNQTETAYAIANEARRLLGCDRVSVAQWNGNRCKVLAISGQDRFDNRANVVRKLQDVATSSVSADSPFWVSGEVAGLAPDVAKQINEYLDEAHSRTLIVLPLALRPHSGPDLEMNRQGAKTRKLGAIIIEYFDADVTEDEIAEKKELIVSQAELAWENSRRHSEVFLLPIFQRLGAAQQFLFRDHFTKSMTGLAALGMFLLLLIFFPKELKMKAEGVMRPAIRQTVFSQVDGSIISEVLIDEQSTVAQNDVLMILKNPDLDYQIAEVKGRIETAKKQREIMISRGSRVGQPTEPSQRDGAVLDDLELLETQQAILEQQLELLNQKKDRLQIRSPIDGTVITPQPKRRLTNLPANSNLAVLEIVDNTGPWELDLKIPQNRIGYITKAMQAQSEPLDVEFRLGTNPNIVLTGKLVSVSNRAVPSQAGHTEYKAIVNANGEQFRQLRDELRTGAGVTAKIHCGTRSLGFVWFYQILDWLRTHVFF